MWKIGNIENANGVDKNSPMRTEYDEIVNKFKYLPDYNIYRGKRGRDMVVMIFCSFALRISFNENSTDEEKIVHVCLRAAFVCAIWSESTANGKITW